MPSSQSPTGVAPRVTKLPEALDRNAVHQVWKHTFEHVEACLKSMISANRSVVAAFLECLPAKLRSDPFYHTEGLVVIVEGEEAWRTLIDRDGAKKGVEALAIAWYDSQTSFVRSGVLASCHASKVPELGRFDSSVAMIDVSQYLDSAHRAGLASGSFESLSNTLIRDARVVASCFFLSVDHEGKVAVDDIYLSSRLPRWVEGAAHPKVIKVH